jgi:hypothetical protein
MFRIIKYKLLILSLFSFVNITIAQENTTYSAILMSLDGEGFVVRDNKEIKLEPSQSLKSNDQLCIQKGNAVVLLFTGKEVPMNAISKYTIPFESNNQHSEISEMTNKVDKGNSLLSQSGVAYQLRGQSKVFPTTSKIISPSNAILRIGYKNLSELNMGLKVIDSQTQRVIYQIKSVSDSLVSLADVPFEKGKSYYWVLNNTPQGKPEMGTLVMTDQADIQNIQLNNNPTSHYEYLNVISAYFNRKYYFETLQFINMAIDTYPDYELYKQMRINLLAH